jgi:hypothetical protein
MPSTFVSRRRFMELIGTGSASAVLAATHDSSAAKAAAGLSPAAPGRQDGAANAVSSNGIQVEEIGAYDVARLNKILTTELAEFSNFEIVFPEAKHAVKLYRVTYPSVVPEMGNRPTIASGLIAIPQVPAGPLPVVSYQHGSVFGKNEVPSALENSTETRLMVALFGGNGYVVVAADYFGKGVSAEPNSYIVKASTQQACYDMLRATQAAAAGFGVEMGPLFLSGWSQGGWSTLVFLNKLESVGVPVTAAGVASGPPDLYATVNRWANNWQKIDASYIPPLEAIMINAFQEYYDLPGFADWAIKPEYQQPTRDLYTNRKTIDEVEPLLPARLPDMLQDEFKAAVARGDDRFSHLLQESHGYRWRTKTPMRVYSGALDEVTPAYIGQLPVGYQQVIGGAEVTAVNAGPKADHRGVFLYGMKDQKEWFDQLVKA